MSNVNGKLSYLGLLIKHSESIPNTGNDKAAVQKRIIKICDSIEESLKYDDELHKKIDEAKLEGVRDREARAGKGCKVCDDRRWNVEQQEQGYTGTWLKPEGWDANKLTTSDIPPTK